MSKKILMTLLVIVSVMVGLLIIVMARGGGMMDGMSWMMCPM